MPNTLRTLALFASALWLVPGAAHAAPRALLIGINDYIEVPDLRGAINDVEMMQEILVSRFGFAPADIEVVKDKEGTREGILAAFDRLARRTKADDVVYIHYSGHGSQATDMDGDEEDGKDETLVAHDSRTQGVPDITDDELGEKLAAIDARTIVIVLDSCHAGTATRSLGALSDANELLGGLRPRFVPEDDRRELYDRPRSRAVVPLISAGHVLLTGAAFDEEALDGPVDRKPHGLFSYAFAKSLSRSAPTASATDVFSGVGHEFERIRGQLNLQKMPDPQLEATSEDLKRPLFAALVEPAPQAGGASAASPPRLAWIAVEPHSYPGRVVLKRGAALGAGRGSLWAIYPPDERRFEPGAAVAEAEVERIDGSDAVARLEPAEAKVPPGARAVALAPPPASSELPVALVDADATRSDALRAALRKRLPEIRFVGSGEFARFVVRCRGASCAVTGADGLFAIADLEAGDVEVLAERLGNLFARSLTASELLALDNPAASLELELGVVAAASAEARPGDERGMVVIPSTDSPRFRIRQPGEPRTASNSLQLRVASDADCTLTVVDVDSSGRVQVIFPNAVSERKGYFPDGALQAGKPLLIPDSLAPGNRAGFHIDYSPPAGSDTVRAFCTRDPRAAQALRTAVAALDPDAPATRGASGSGLGGLRQQLASLASRGLQIVEDVPPPVVEEPVPEPVAEPVAPPPPAWRADWAAASVTIEVTE